jgi:hypothetical protein
MHNAGHDVAHALAPHFAEQSDGGIHSFGAPAILYA